MKPNLLIHFTSLVFPGICPVCGAHLFRGETLLCTRCVYHMPRVDITDLKNNPVAAVFWGRTKIEMAASLFFYMKGNRYQNILHQLKYKGKRHIGTEMGKLLGKELLNSSFGQIDFIHPIPLHYRKMRVRGYNQSELIALGISEILKKPLVTQLVKRETGTETQTRKSRFQRWENVEGIFKITDRKAFANRHVLLVDDVITTGSTLEACANEVLKIPGSKVSIATLAFTRMN